MAKYRVAVIGTVGKSVLIDDTLSSRVAKLETQIANVGGVGAHSALTGLRRGDDHPQYTMWQAPETIKALWNFQTIPYIQGETLAEYIEDVVAGGSDPFIADSSSITWTYDDTGNHLQADVVDEYIEDLVGSMLVNTTYIDLDYGDSDGSIKAILDTGAVLDLIGGQLQDSSTIDFTYNSGTKLTSAAVSALPAGVFANPSASVGLAAVNGSATTAMRSDAAPALSQSISPTWTGTHTFSGAQTTLKATDVVLEFNETDQASDETIWWMRANSKSFRWTTRTDAGGPGRDVFVAGRGSGIAISSIELGNTTDNAPVTFLGTGAVKLAADNQELQLGASQDLRLYHDGTNSVIRNDTGHLLFQNGATEGMRFTSSGGLQIGSSSGTNYALLAYRNTSTLACYIRQDGTGDVYRMDAAGGFPMLAVSQARITLGASLRLAGYTVSTLPASPLAGDTAYVTDANATTFLSTVAGGGSNVVPVFYDGTNWKIG